MIQKVRPRRLALGALAALATVLLAATGPADHARASDSAGVANQGPTYVPGEIVVGYAPGPAAGVARDVMQRSGLRTTTTSPPDAQIVRVPKGETVSEALARVRGQRGIAYAVPDYIAHSDGRYIPNDPGRAHTAGGWRATQWNFLQAAGVDAPQAWSNLIAAHRPGGRGVVIAVLDTGIAYRNWHQFRKSPDFSGTRFVAPYDFIANNRYPLDRNDHGTFIAGLIAEATNNHKDLTGIAYGATIMPVRVLDANGDGDAATIARGIRYAVSHHAQVINLSLEFPPTTTASDIPDVLSAIAYAHRHGVVVTASSGNEGITQLDYPAADPLTISVGASTSDRCLAYYSNYGRGLDLVAPGGGDDTNLLSDPACHPARNLPSIVQLSFNPPHWGRFQYISLMGTSMSAPEAAAVAALVIASGNIGQHPTPAEVLARLEHTARPLDGAAPNQNYGYGLIDAGAATAPVTATSGKR